MEEIQLQELESSTSSNGHNFFTCEICVQLVPVDRQFKSMEMSGCLHPYCNNCVAKYIREKVIEHNMPEIKCANPDCNVMLDASLCQSALPKRVFEKWCRVLCESVVLLDSSEGGLAHGRSYCPYRDCSELILYECVRISASTNSNSTSNKITRSNLTMFCSWRWLSSRDWYDVQIASVMLSVTGVVLSSNAGVKPNFATNVEGRHVNASTPGAIVCSYCSYCLSY
ncbi:hypothetical protein MKW98_011300 [Papaver atlanticum]|uniref:Uncharacterized protein n=1 Tax=Papaver atlanticum TaxID=357466 RepID=A0AAD4SVP1_9MAGN|nr:hypothetical protein MKW98_011300 [Papaver atlanticum]